MGIFSRFPDFRVSAAPAASSGRHCISGWFDGLGCNDFRHTKKIAGGTEELRHLVRPINPEAARFVEVAGGFHPAKRLLDSLADALAGFVGVEPDGSSIKSRGLPAFDTGHMRGDPAATAIPDKLLRFIAFVRSHAFDLKAKHCQFIELLRSRIRLGVALSAGRRDVQLGQQATAIVAHGMHPKTQLCLLAKTFTGQARIRIRRRGMRFVRTLLPLDVDTAVVLSPGRRRLFLRAKRLQPRLFGEKEIGDMVPFEAIHVLTETGVITGCLVRIQVQKPL